MKSTMIGLMMVIAIAVGCSRKAEQKPAKPIEVPKAFVGQKPSGEPVPIPRARALKVGSEVVLQGRVMGVKDPFVEGRSVFVLGDTGTIKPCPDRCAKPWDACCAPAEVRAKGTVTIQVLDAEGGVLARGIKGVNGLKELSVVTVAGTVAPNSSKEAFVVNAKSVYVEPEESAN